MINFFDMMTEEEKQKEIEWMRNVTYEFIKDLSRESLINCCLSLAEDLKKDAIVIARLTERIYLLEESGEK